MKNPIVLLAMLFLAAAVQAQTVRRVPEDYTDIQSAVDACVNGDIVELNDGVWTGSGTSVIEVLNLTVTIRNATDATPIIDGEAIRHGLTVFGTLSSTIILEGVEIRNGLAVLSGAGGAMWVNNPNASVELTDCLFTDNEAADSGGAIYTTRGSSLQANSCEFLRNQSGMDGGGLALDGEALLSACVLDDNTAGSAGGAIAATSIVSIVNCGFKDDVAAIGPAVHFGKAAIASIGDTSICDCGPTPIVGSYTDLGGNDILETCPIPPIVVAQDGSGDFTTIQEAVGAVEDGGTIEVRAGTYLIDTRGGQSIELGLKGFTMIGEGPETTIIEGTTQDSWEPGSPLVQSLSSLSTPWPECRFEGLTFKKGGGDSCIGGAVHLRSRHAVFRSCHFLENYGDNGCGGPTTIGVEGSLEAVDCVFRQNTSLGPLIGSIDEEWASSNELILTRCLIEVNTTRGITPRYGSLPSASITDCTFRDNITEYRALVHLDCYGDKSVPLTFRGNLIEGNSSGYECLDLYVSDSETEDPFDFRDNVIRNNITHTRKDTDPDASAVRISTNRSLILAGNEICGNNLTPLSISSDGLSDLGGNCIASSCDDVDGDGIPDQCQSVGDGVHQVPEEFPTIQAAVDHAGWGDVVEVGPGTWTGDGDAVVRVGYGPLTIRGTASAEDTVIDGEATRLTILTDPLNTLTLENLTLRDGGNWRLAAFSKAAILMNCRLESSAGGSGFAEASSDLTMVDCDAEIAEGSIVSCRGFFDALRCDFQTGGSYGDAITSHGGFAIEQCSFDSGPNTGILYDYEYSGGATKTIRNCVLYGASSSRGLYVSGSVTIVDTQFLGFGGNTSSALRLENGDDPVTNTLIERCMFRGPRGFDGGAIFVFAPLDGAVQIRESTFEECASLIVGGAVAVWGNSVTSSNITFDGCIFTGNNANDVGGAIYARHPILLTGCTFAGNSAASAGGAIYATEAITMTGCHFENNVAIDTGGAVTLNTTSQPSTLIDNVFQNNYALSAGGGLAIQNTTASITGGSFAGNDAQYAGGLWMLGGTADISGTAFSSNTAFARGGAIEILGSTLTLDGVLLSDNRALAGAGGIQALALSAVSAVDSTFCSNEGDTPEAHHYEVDTSSIWTDLGGNIFASACLGACPTDLDQNGVTNGQDLGLLFVAWGSCPDCQPDLNGDGVVNGQDLGILFVGWGPCD